MSKQLAENFTYKWFVPSLQLASQNAEPQICPSLSSKGKKECKMNVISSKVFLGYLPASDEFGGAQDRVCLHFSSSNS